MPRCFSKDCAGCYDVGDGRMIHPPKCAADYLRPAGKVKEKKGKNDSQPRLRVVPVPVPPKVDLNFLTDVDWTKVESTK